MSRSRRRWVPSREQLERNRVLRPVAHRLEDPALWRFTRHSVARGTALGLFAGFILPLGQIALACLLAVPCRANMFVAATATLVTNPFTFPAVYYAAYAAGRWVIGDAAFAGESDDWLRHLVASAADVTVPTFVGLAIFAIVSAALGYPAVRLGWRLWIGWRWRRRSERRS